MSNTRVIEHFSKYEKILRIRWTIQEVGGYFHIMRPPSMIQSYRVNPHITDNCYPRETRTYIDSQNPIPIVRMLL